MRFVVGSYIIINPSVKTMLDRLVAPPDIHLFAFHLAYIFLRPKTRRDGTPLKRFPALAPQPTNPLGLYAFHPSLALWAKILAALDSGRVELLTLHGTFPMVFRDVAYRTPLQVSSTCVGEAPVHLAAAVLAHCTACSGCSCCTQHLKFFVILPLCSTGRIAETTPMRAR